MMIRHGIRPQIQASPVYVEVAENFLHEALDWLQAVAEVVSLAPWFGDFNNVWRIYIAPRHGQVWPEGIEGQASLIMFYEEMPDEMSARRTAKLELPKVPS